MYQQWELYDAAAPRVKRVHHKGMLLFELHNNCGKSHGSARYGFTFECIVDEEIIAERRDLHIWTQLSVTVLAIYSFTHKKTFFLETPFFRSSFSMG